ncbi:DUF1501 domain-containing protein [Tuwongella immobilis]|uniref:DUF1501 domain-containing protein n=1 Tax=Tuwongella immobilis TaxID=692036 RepID=A0A6C2YHT3_9BACT|nr:DUF1501 domain-containing protein [Tuwongella immobilis]VIP00924.1 hypothetical protein : Uncharacterized protein OS=Singulisphaera acidiphila (strain ATCC BAA-1392 / DSM 18658 / VKM B-2454 / MOB10) GN=Sinac_0700 PE=4 SV=1: DUF1501 [Tuwongella immobilis]VTR97266.1 hypothetical protein : Uncharacterized protein OS=Singulisphaera acidiphila (strain ATCC BAA-1392 / DSM 18658 / VKM B-2454 / MOB10) GN=Sinac_0700 PE=4 SV=1: DUF1501 [Tuwongella immobilis]
MSLNDVQLTMNPDGLVSRRSFLGAGMLAGLSGLSLRERLRAAGPELRKRDLSVILLFMQGAPSQFETFDPKPGTPTGGPTKGISTSIPGVQIAEYWPKMAAMMNRVALIRSLNSRDVNHPSAQYLLRTGYKISGSVKYPHFGSIVAQESGGTGSDLPPFVAIAGNPAAGSGYLSKSVAPFVITDPTRPPVNTQLPAGMTKEALQRRLRLTAKLEQDFAAAGAKSLVKDHQAINDAAARLVLSPKLKEFDLSEEKDSLRDRYGRNSFGQGCLLARRLTEVGVPFVEVSHGNWDTHRENFEGHERLSSVVDAGFSTLLEDLKQRGRLNKTLVIWTGEFGRTPTINGNNGRDHYGRAFNGILAGAGIKPGVVVGKTDSQGREIAERPVSVQDLFCTLCEVLGINPRQKIETDGRGIRIVDGGEAVKEVLA